MKPISEKEVSAEVEIIRGEVKRELYSQDKADTVVSSIEYMFYKNIDSPYQDSVNRLVKEYVSQTVAWDEAEESGSNLTIGYMEDALDKFRNAYNQELALEGEDGYWGMPWESSTSAEIYQDNPEFVEVSLANWEYAGGAHGNASSEYHIIDIKTAQELKLEDFFSSVDELTAKAEVIFRADQEVPDHANLEDAGFWFEDGIFKLNENFVFNEESIDFLYNQYEIAPYAAGVIIVSIPLEEVQHLLKRKVKF